MKQIPIELKRKIENFTVTSGGLNFSTVDRISRGKKSIKTQKNNIGQLNLHIQNIKKL